MHIAVTCQNDMQCLNKAQNLSHSLDLPFSPSIDSYDYALHVTSTHLELISHPKYRFKPFWINFSHPSFRYRLLQQKKQKDIFKKVFGIKANHFPCILDATAGLGTDGLIFAYMGCNVHLSERCLIIAALLEDALERAQTDTFLSPCLSRIQLSKKDAKDILYGLSRTECPDIIYLDPMFPTRSKTALHKKPMQLLQHIVGQTNDAHELLLAALAYTKNRVVVKRPIHGPYLHDLPPHHTIQTKQIRHDIYLADEHNLL